MKYKLSYGAIPREIKDWKCGCPELLKKCMEECMIEMDFVTFEIAKKLKEKGYPMAEIPTGGIDNRNIPILYDLPKEHPNWQDCKAWWIPTISQVMKWLRDKKRIFIQIKIGDAWAYDIYKFTSSGRFYAGIDGSFYIYQSYEHAALAGIKDVIDNLI